MMKKTSKRMIISVLTLVLTVVALGTTTFAWFSLSTTSLVSNIGGQITTGDGLEVKLARIDSQGTSVQTSWMSNIDATGFFDSAFRFDAVTTSTNEFKFTKMHQGGDGVITLTQDAKANTDYLDFEIQLRSQLGGTVELIDLIFKGTPTIFDIDGNKYYQYFQTTPTETSYKVETSAINAARISFTYLNAKGNEVSAASSVYQHHDNNGENTLRYDAGRTLVTGNAVMGVTGVDYGQWSYLKDSRGLNIMDSDNVSALVPSAISILDAHTSVKTGETPNTTVDLLPNFDGTGYYGAVLKVRIWIEGWDADAYDSIYKTNLNVDVTFKKQQLSDEGLLIVGQRVLQNILNDSKDDEQINLLPAINGFNVVWEHSIDEVEFTPVTSPFTRTAGTLRGTIKGTGTLSDQIVTLVIPQP